MNFILTQLTALILVAVGISCATVRPRTEAQLANMKLAIVETLKPGKSLRYEAETLFGLPDSEEIVDSAGKVVRWTYLIDSLPRIELTFDQTTNLINSVHWNMSQNDVTRDLISIRKRFGKKLWQPRAGGSANPHYFPDECFLDETTSGVSIQIKRSSQEVVAIAWTDPLRAPSQSSTSDKSESCIGMTCTEFSKAELSRTLCGSFAK